MKQSNYDPKFNSILSNNLYDFLKLKRSLGYKYQSEARMLQRIDEFLVSEQLDKSGLSEDIVLKWSLKRETESQKTHFTRVSVMRQFAVYLNKNGISASLPQQISRSAFSKTFTPYIFTNEQIATLISNADNMPEARGQSKINIIFPAVLRLLYCCGLRISEATALRIFDLDLNRGTITIRDSKNDNNRIVPISDSLKIYMIDYFNKIHLIYTDNDFLFPTNFKEQYSPRCIYGYFRKILWQSGISHGGRGSGPRLHDLRHTFAVHSLQNWIIQGKDTYILLPILSAYLGHKNIYATEKYLRLTSEMYPNILEKVQDTCGEIIPEVINYEAN